VLEFFRQKVKIPVLIAIRSVEDKLLQRRRMTSTPEWHMKQDEFFNEIGFFGRPRFGRSFRVSIWYLACFCSVSLLISVLSTPIFGSARYGLSPFPEKASFFAQVLMMTGCAQPAKIPMETVYFNSAGDGQNNCLFVFCPGGGTRRQVLPKEQVFTVEGGHNWPTWRSLWEEILRKSVLAQKPGAVNK
jgi:hypothetical protein